MSKNLVAVSFFAILLAACGSPKKSPDAQGNGPGGGPGGKTPQFSSSDEAACQRLNGFVTADKVACVTEITKTLSEGAGSNGTTYFSVDGSFHDGKFLVADAPTRSALVLVNRHLLANASGLRQVVLNAGYQGAELGIQLQRTLRKDEYVTLNVYECKDHSMSIIGCVDAWIP